MEKFSFRKKWAVPAGIALALTFFLALFLFFGNTWRPWEAFSAQTALVLRVNGLEEFRQCTAAVQDPAWRDAFKAGLFSTMLHDAATATRLFGHDATVSKALQEGSLFAGFTLHDADHLHPLFALELPERIDLQRLLEGNGLSTKFFPSTFHEQTLYTVHLPEEEKFVVTRLGRVLLFSRFSYLVEDGIAQLDGNAPRQDNAFLQPDKSPGLLDLFVCPEALGTQLSGKLAKRWSGVPELLSRNLRWAQLSWDGQQAPRLIAEPDGFLSGMSSWGNHPRDAIFAVLPDHLALLAWAGFGNRAAFLDDFSKTQSPEFGQFVKPWVGNEAAWALAEPFSPELSDEQFIVLSMRDSAQARQRLNDYGAARGLLRHYDYQTFEIRQFLSGDLLSGLIGNASGEAFKNPVCVALGDYMVFGTSPSVLEVWIDKYVVNQTLANRPDFLQVNQSLPAEANAFVLLRADLLTEISKGFFAEKDTLPGKADWELLSDAGLVGLQLRAPGPHRLEGNLASQPTGPTETAPSSASIQWKTSLAAAAAGPLSVVRGGRPDAEEVRILVQDVRHELYCLDAGGAVRWRRQFPERFLSPVKGVDFEGNGDPFFLFNTAHEIYLLDEKGNNVEGFPLRLQSPATNSLAVVDFDGNHKYAFFVACENGNLYGYDQFGRPQPGWNPRAGVGKVVHPLLHFQHGGKDYLTALNQEGQLMVFARNGAAHFPEIQLSGKFKSAPQVDMAGPAPRIVVMNTLGRAYVCNLTGAIFELAVLPPDPKTPAAFLLDPLVGDKRAEYVGSRGGLLRISGYDKGGYKTLFERQFPENQDTVFAPAPGYIGLLCRSKRQIMMLNAEGKALRDFPLAGSTPFVVTPLFSKQEEQVLLVGNGASVYAYKVN